MLKKLLLVGLLAGISGCDYGPKLPFTQAPVDVTFTSGAARANVDRLDIIDVRAYLRQDKEWVEKSSARCTLRGQGFRASFSPPAQVLAPVYRGRTDPIFILCRMSVNGVERVTSQTIEARNLSRPDDEGVTITTGTEGTSVAAVINLRDRTKDRFDYSSVVHLRFRP